MDGVTFNTDGTVDIDLDGPKVHLRRPKVREFRELMEMIDAADAQWNEKTKAALEGEFPQAIVDQASELAIADFRQANGREPRNATERAEQSLRAVDYCKLIMSGRLLASEGGIFAYAWSRIIVVLGGEEIAADDLPAWAANPTGLAPLRDHWMAVPLHLGPQDDASRASPNGLDPNETANSPSP